MAAGYTSRLISLPALLGVGLIQLAGAPEMAGVYPAADARVASLTQVVIIFSGNVQGVDAGDLMLEDVASTRVTAYSPREYAFDFPEAPPGLVTVAWASGHNITDLETPPNPFAGGTWQYTVDPTAPPVAVHLAEFLASNDSGLRDEDGGRSDWIEVFNAGDEPVLLLGWSLTDDAGDAMKWRFPAMSLPGQGRLLVWASGKDRTDPAAPLHTNFRLSDSADYLALFDSSTNLMSDFAPVYPAQQADISYGRDAVDPGILGYFPTPTPGEVNLPGGPGFAPEPAFSIPGGVYGSTTLAVTISAPGGEIRFTTNGTLPTEASPLVAGPVTLAGSRILQARVFEPGLLPSRIKAETYHLAVANLTNFTSNLPLLLINTSGRAIPEDLRIPAFVTTIEPWRGRARLGDRAAFQGHAQIEVRGQTSAGFPKRPYNLELNDVYGSDLEAPLLGLPAESDWVLHNPYSDKSLLNNFLSFELHEQMGHYAVRRRFVEVFVDQSGGPLEYPRDYVGVYVLLEKIKVDGNRVDLARLTPGHAAEPGITGGYIVKKDKNSPGDLDFSTSGGPGFSGQQLKMHEPKPDEVTLAQVDWIRNYLNAFERALYASNWRTATGANHYSHYIDVDSFVDYHWIVEFTKQIDGYRLSNYLSKDRGGRLRMAPIWDWNLSLGNADYLDGQYVSGWYHNLISADQHLYLRRLINGTSSASGTSGDPDFRQRLIDRWAVLRTNVLNGPRILARVDEIAAYLDQAQRREFSKWPRLGTYVWPNPAFYTTPTTYAGIIAAKRNWIQGRFAWIDSQNFAPPSFDAFAGYVTRGFPLTLSTTAPLMVYTLDGTDPRRPGGSVAPWAVSYNEPLTITSNVQIVARGRTVSTWGAPSTMTWITDPSRLRITELMVAPHRPPAGDTNSASDFDFIELLNTGPAPLHLGDYAFTDGVAFRFATGSITTLDPGSHVLLAHDLAALTRRYGDLPNLAGQYEGSLANQGERITLTGPSGEVVQSFHYEAGWHPATDGLGFSLVPVDVEAPLTDWNNPASWRPSARFGGSPGQQDPPRLAIPAVLVNEALTHTDAPDVDFIELFNPDSNPVDISGWFLSDDPRIPKYRIPPNTVLDAGGYRVFTEQQFNADPNAPESFTLRSSGDEVYLFSANAAGELTGYRHGFRFGAALNGDAFGRWVSGTGEEMFLAQTATSPGGPNPGPQVGPVIISEIMYHPPEVLTNGAAWNNTEHEYLELLHLGSGYLPLVDPNVSTNAWQLRDAVRYTFPTNAVLAPNERVLVVGFDPTAETGATSDFRNRYGLSSAVRLFGPFEGSLDNGGESVELVQPDLVRFYATNEVITEVLVDRVYYRDEAPWPAGADGFGFALHRLSGAAQGDDPTNWAAGIPTPGAAYSSGPAPAITQQPGSQVANAGASLTLEVQVNGTVGLEYQWRKNGLNLAGATNEALAWTGVQPADSGLYQVVVSTATGVTASLPAELKVLTPPVLHAQPLSTNVAPTTTVTFSIVAASLEPMIYQWRRDGVAIPGADGFSYVSPEARLTGAGIYDIIVSSLGGSITSAPAVLVIEGDPIIVQPPIALSAPVGGTATFSVQVTNTSTLPVGYTWYRDDTPIASRARDSTLEFLTLTNLQAGDAGLYSVRVTNVAALAPGYLSVPVQLVLLPDRDLDALPDSFETAHDLDPDSALDALLDQDGDGASNRDEYLGGTDPSSSNSVLRVEVFLAGGDLILRFEAAPDRTYSLLRRDSSVGGSWQVLDSIPGRGGAGGPSHTVEFTEPWPLSPGERYYQVVAPARSDP